MLNQNVIKSLGTSTWWAGGLLSLLGLVGIFFPWVLSLTIEFFLSWLTILAATLWGYYVYKWNKTSFIHWLKPLILLIAGVLLIIFPLSGVATITLLMAFYLLTDAFGSFALAFEHKPLGGWFWMILNGLLSLVLSLVILVGWPATSLIYLGIIIGISLLFDGLSLLMFGFAMKKSS